MKTSDWLDLIESMRASLLAAITERPKRPEWVDTPGGTELGWIVFERETMLAAVNDERKRHGLPPVSMQDVAAAESSAAGHTDYVAKFALSCAELATKGHKR